MNFVIVTGVSGAGKSTALKFFEDINYFCIDNLPPILLSKFFQLLETTSMNNQNVALGIDVRGGTHFEELFEFISELKEKNVNVKILFFDANNEVLLKRFKESRRIHPLAKGVRIINGIEQERVLLSEVKSRADYVIDTSNVLARQLKQTISDIFMENKDFDSMIINIMSFGFKYGIPTDADLVFDVRFIPNPFYIPELKNLTGNDEPVWKYVMQFEESRIFLNKLEDMIKFLIPHYVKEGKNQLVIAIGCTGGKHRSVTIANKLYDILKNFESGVIKTHKDIDKDREK